MPHLHGRLFCVRFFDKNGSIWQSCIYSTAALIMIIGTLLMEIIVLRWFHTNIVITENF